jgi:enoyl-CoA hydratase
MTTINPPLRVTIDDRVAWVTMDRPATRNAITMDMLRELIAAFESLGTDNTVRVIILSGSLSTEKPAFAAGGDIGEFETLSDEKSVLGYQELYRKVGDAIESAPQPTVAAIAGPCVGGGAILAAACDLRIASPSAKFGIPIARTLGNCLNIDDYLRISTLIGPAKVKELIFTSRLINATEMLAWGVVSQLVTSETELRDAAAQLAEGLKNAAPLTLSSTKENLRRIKSASRPAAGDVDLLLRCFLSEDFVEGVTAFRDHRPPKWSGR